MLINSLIPQSNKLFLGLNHPKIPVQKLEDSLRKATFGVPEESSKSDPSNKKPSTYSKKESADSLIQKAIYVTLNFDPKKWKLLHPEEKLDNATDIVEKIIRQTVHDLKAERDEAIADQRRKRGSNIGEQQVNFRIIRNLKGYVLSNPLGEPLSMLTLPELTPERKNGWKRFLDEIKGPNDQLEFLHATENFSLKRFRDLIFPEKDIIPQSNQDRRMLIGNIIEKIIETNINQFYQGQYKRQILRDRAEINAFIPFLKTSAFNQFISKWFTIDPKKKHSSRLVKQFKNIRHEKTVPDFLRTALSSMDISQYSSNLLSKREGTVEFEAPDFDFNLNPFYTESTSSQSHAPSSLPTITIDHSHNVLDPEEEAMLEALVAGRTSSVGTYTPSRGGSPVDSPQSGFFDGAEDDNMLANLFDPYSLESHSASPIPSSPGSLNSNEQNSSFLFQTTAGSNNNFLSPRNDSFSAHGSTNPSRRRAMSVGDSAGFNTNETNYSDVQHSNTQMTEYQLQHDNFVPGSTWNGSTPFIQPSFSHHQSTQQHWGSSSAYGDQFGTDDSSSIHYSLQIPQQRLSHSTSAPDLRNFAQEPTASISSWDTSQETIPLYFSSQQQPSNFSYPQQYFFNPNSSPNR